MAEMESSNPEPFSLNGKNLPTMQFELLPTKKHETALIKP